MIDLLRRRRFGRSAVSISSLGFGGNALSNVYAAVDEADAVDAVAASCAGGVRYFDTAPLHGHGLGEHRLGRALRGFARDSYVLSTKVGREVEASLALLGQPIPTAFWTAVERLDGSARPVEAVR